MSKSDVNSAHSDVCFAEYIYNSSQIIMTKTVIVVTVLCIDRWGGYLSSLFIGVAITEEVVTTTPPSPGQG